MNDIKEFPYYYRYSTEDSLPLQYQIQDWSWESQLATSLLAQQAPPETRIWIAPYRYLDLPEVIDFLDKTGLNFSVLRTTQTDSRFWTAEEVQMFLGEKPDNPKLNTLCYQILWALHLRTYLDPLKVLKCIKISGQKLRQAYKSLSGHLVENSISAFWIGFRLSYPLRKVYYFLNYQIKKRILRCTK